MRNSEERRRWIHAATGAPLPHQFSYSYTFTDWFGRDVRVCWCNLTEAHQIHNPERQP